MKRFAVALTAGALALPAVALAQVMVVPASPPVYAAPAPQAGVSYYCANPQGWYPAVQTCSANWVGYGQPQPLVQIAPNALPPAQAGVTYWCERPQGWYPTVSRCSTNWVAYTQPVQTTTYVVTTAPAYVAVPPPPATDPASAVYYVGPHRNAPYQSGIYP